MPNVVPSQIVEFIDIRFSELKHQLGPNPPPAPNYDVSRYGPVSTIIYLIEQLPANLLTLNGHDYVRFMEAVHELKASVAQWGNGSNHSLHKMKDGSRLSPITVIRQSLAKCHDQGADETTNELLFINDTDFRETLRQDISYTNQALANAEWKATTVLAGSVIEALLLDSIAQYKSESSSDFSKILEISVKGNELGAGLSKKPNEDPNKRDWSLHHYIHIAFRVGVISETTAKECMLIKDFRNLIHPGKAKRKNQECDRGTAHMAIAGMEHVLKDIQRWFE